MKFLSEAIEEFLVANEADGLATTTLDWYRAMLKQITAFMPDRNLENVTTDDLRKFIIKMRSTYAPDTTHGHIRVQHRFWRWCSLEYGLTNPMRNIKYPAMPKQTVPRAVDVDDMTKLLRLFSTTSYVDRRDKAILYFLADTGCRVSGLCTLTVANLDIQRRHAIVTEKGRKTRTIVFTPFTAEVLQQWMDVRATVEPVFYNLTTHRALTRFGVEQLLRRLRTRAGVKGRTNPHAFRHAFGREYLRNGGDLATLSRLMGHANVETTLKYYALFSQDELAEQHANYSFVKSFTQHISSESSD